MTLNEKTMFLAPFVNEAKDTGVLNIPRVKNSSLNGG